MSEIVIAIASLSIAYFAYSLSSEKFYSELLTRRHDAYVDLIETAEERFGEARDTVNAFSALVPRPKQEAYFRACRTARSLFGVEVSRSIERLDRAALDCINAFDELRESPGVESRRRYFDALSSHLAANDELSDRVKPYIGLGRRGIPPFQRLKIAFAHWRNDKRGG